MKHTDEFIQELLDLEQDQVAGERVEEDSRPASALELFEQGLTKSDLKVMAGRTIDSVLNQGNVLQVAEAISAMELFIKEVKDDKRFKDYVREEARKTPKGFISKSGAKIEVCETGTAYDFSSCGDPLLKDFEERVLANTEDVKTRKEFLKTLPLSGLEIRIEDELVKIYPPAKSSTSSYKITLAK